MSRKETFSPYYKKQISHFHRVTRVGWGGSLKDAGALDSFMFEWQPDEILDYGCGKGAMVEMFIKDYKIPLVVGYDPGVEQFQKADLSRQYQVVCCNDVLEHIEPEYLDNVLEELNGLAKQYVWLRIDTRPAKKILPDGRNAHLILESQEWWKKKDEQFFDGKIIFENFNRKGKYEKKKKKT